VGEMTQTLYAHMNKIKIFLNAKTFYEAIVIKVCVIIARIDKLVNGAEYRSP
jgi:hypothetical protein